MKSVFTWGRAARAAALPLLLAMPLAAPAADSASAWVPIGEMIVTARKREESVLEVPVAVTAFSASDIAALGLTDITDLARFTPGMAMNSALGRQPSSYRPVFRGVTTIRNGVTNANAGNTFIDGVYVGSALVLAGAVSGRGGGLSTALAFFALGQAGLIVIAWIYQWTTRYDFAGEIEKDNVAAGVAFGGNCMAVGIVLMRGLRCSRWRRPE